MTKFVGLKAQIAVYDKDGEEVFRGYHGEVAKFIGIGLHHFDDYLERDYKGYSFDLIEPLFELTDVYTGKTFSMTVDELDKYFGYDHTWLTRVLREGHLLKRRYELRRVQ